jgi:hypothetical protein
LKFQSAGTGEIGHIESAISGNEIRIASSDMAGSSLEKHGIWNRYAST